MPLRNKKEPAILLLGDVFFLVAALWFALFLRYGETEVWSQFALHIGPFFVLFFVWIFVFFVAGLYEKHTLGLKSRLPSLLLGAQVTNTVIAVIFFYLIPYFGLAPRTNLFIYLIVSFAFLMIWRNGALGVLSSRRRFNAVLVGTGRELVKLEQEVNNNRRYSFHFVKVVDAPKRGKVDCIGDIRGAVVNKDATLIVLDTQNPIVESIIPDLYNLIFQGVTFIELDELYEEIFDRIPLSLVRHSWFLENMPPFLRIYNTFKRGTDIIFSFILGLISLLLYPFIILAIKLDDNGPIFYSHMRIGKGGKPFEFIKFRTMSSMDTGEESLNSKAEITSVGRYLRASRLDELPQLWNVLRGDLSFVGPRPEVPELVSEYEKKIPHYGVRHLIKPGVSGWAQMYHEEPGKFGLDYEATADKLSYDLFYIKNRSLLLDIKIALKTLKVFFSRHGK